MKKYVRKQIIRDLEPFKKKRRIKLTAYLLRRYNEGGKLKMKE